MGIFKKFSLADWLKQLGGACRRFPASVLLLAFLTGLLVFLNHGGVDRVDVKWRFFYIFFPATGALLAASLQLLTEDFKSHVAAVVTQVVLLAAWLGVSLWLTQFDRFSMPQFVAVSATVVTMVLSLFLLCFYHRDDDVPFWNFSQRTFVALVAGFVVGGILTLGLVLFVQSLEWLFGVTVKDNMFADIPSVCMVFIAPLLTMSLMPAGDEKRDHSVQGFSGFIKGVVQYLFIPLLLLYLVTLYIYAAKILITWQLPVGWVCYLVSASMLGMVILLFITYPVQHEHGSTFFKTLMRWMPLVMLPLLVLMSVAIGRRLSDYGITVSRLYVLVFNIWCYVVCFGLVLCRNRRIWWVPATFAVVLFLISVGPQSIPNMTRRQLLCEARDAFAASGVTQLPMSGEQYDRWLDSADEKVAASIDAKLFYLQTYYDIDTTLGLLDKDAVVGAVMSGYDRVKDNAAQPSIYYSNYNLIQDVDLPQGFTHMTIVDGDVDDLVGKQGNRLTIALGSNGDDAHQFEFDLKQFAERDKERNRASSIKPLVVSNEGKTLVVQNFTVQLEGDSITYINLSGILLTK